MEVTIQLLWSFDSLLGLTLIWLAWLTLSSEDLFKGIVLFIIFGLLMALTWVRLGAPDVALTEAALGAGITGALLLVALVRLEAASGQKYISSTKQNSLDPEVTSSNLPPTTPQRDA